MKNNKLMIHWIQTFVLCLAFFLVAQNVNAATSVEISPLNPPSGIDLTCNSPQINNDAVSYVFRWFVNDNLVQSNSGYNGGNPFTTAPTSTLAGSHVTSGAEIKCRMELVDKTYIGQTTVQVRTDAAAEESSDDSIPLQITPEN